MSDLVKRLRSKTIMVNTSDVSQALFEAADRIEELEAGECELCGGDKLTAHICKQFAFRPDVAAAQIIRLQQQLDAVRPLIDEFLLTRPSEDGMLIWQENFRAAILEEK